MNPKEKSTPSNSKEFYNLIVNKRYDGATERVMSILLKIQQQQEEEDDHDENDEVVVTSFVNNELLYVDQRNKRTPFHMCCGVMSNVPISLINAIIDITSHAPKKNNSIDNSTFNNTRVDDIMSIRDQMGNTSLHLACMFNADYILIKTLLERSIDTLSLITNKNHNNETPIDILIRKSKLNSKNNTKTKLTKRKGKDIIVTDFWKKLQLLILVSYYQCNPSEINNHNNNNNNKKKNTKIISTTNNNCSDKSSRKYQHQHQHQHLVLHATVGITHNSSYLSNYTSETLVGIVWKLCFEDIIDKLDVDGNTALHIALSNASLLGSTFFFFGSKIIFDLINRYPIAVTKRNYIDNRLPLHCAIATSINIKKLYMNDLFNKIIDKILNIYPQSLFERDGKTNLPPFLLCAATATAATAASLSSSDGVSSTKTIANSNGIVEDNNETTTTTTTTTREINHISLIYKLFRMYPELEQYVS